MEATIRISTLYFTILLTGLSAGFFYAWSVSVIPGTRKIMDPAYLETMQSINRAILNPAFYIIFFGSLIFLISSTLLQYRQGMDTVFWLILAAMACYLIGTFGVTIFGNVPLNETLDAVPLADLSSDQLANTRQSYEVRWNQFHTVRTFFAVLSFLMLLLATFGELKTSLSSINS